jgi:hypothetical protein
LLLKPLPGETRYGLGDTHDHDPELRQQCHRRGCELVATRRGPHPHRDGGVEVRKILHKLRSQAIEPLNGLFKNVFEWLVKMPVKGVQRAQLLALGAVVVYPLVLRYQHEHDLPLGKGLKPLWTGLSWPLAASQDPVMSRRDVGDWFARAAHRGHPPSMHTPAAVAAWNELVRDESDA